MSLITGENTWEPNVYNFEETDVVKGGPDGIDNRPLRQLANRTIWLKNAMRGYDGVTVVTANKTLVKADVFQKLVVINAASGSFNCILPLLVAEDAGLVVPIVAYALNGNQQVTITSQGGSDILVSQSTRSKLFLGNSDRIELVWIGSQWILADYTGNLFDVGLTEFAYSIKPNTIIADGSLQYRAAYPRLWEYVQSLGAAAISDFGWNAVADYKGFFSTGNGTTTFRVPDLRSMFIRGLDLGRGISLARNSDQAGGYEADEFKAHTHGFEGVNPSSGGGDGSRKSVPTGKQTDSTGGSETRSKNIGLIPLIKL